MRLSVTHRTRYFYDRKVYLEPHTFRFCPRSDGAQRLLAFAIQIEPRPMLTSQCLDTEGNTVTQAWFDAKTDHLHVSSAFEADTWRENPYDFLLTDAGTMRLPAKYGHSAPRLACYLGKGEAAAPVREFARSVAAESANKTLEFLPRLSRQIFELCKHEVRHTGRPRPPEITLAEKRGACRDLAALFVAACRSMGLAARFVSGYQHGEEAEERREMHAWAEVYLPGGGWRGFDPSHGVAAGDSLVTVAAAADPASASPVTGTFRGDGAIQRMEFDIEIS